MKKMIKSTRNGRYALFWKVTVKTDIQGNIGDRAKIFFQ